MALLAKPGAFFIPGSDESLLSKADRDKKWRTQCGTVDLDLASPPWDHGVGRQGAE